MSRRLPLFLAVGLLASLPLARPAHSIGAPDRHRWSVADLFSSPTPFALGHRGYGENDGEDPTRPLANTLDAFHDAFTDGIRVVELDLQKTADGKIVVYHDDALEDLTCVSSLTYDELLARKPQIPLFRSMLHAMRHFGYEGRLSGLLFAEIKVPIPLCDGANTSEQAEVSESALVAAVVKEIRDADMVDQVILNAGSPTILRQVALQAPEIRRALTLNALQLLDPVVVQGIIHQPVVLIPKNDFGLEWYNVGLIARLPRILSVPQFVGLSLAVGSKAVSVDRLVFLQAGGNAAGLVGALHGVGLKAVAWTVDAAPEWDFLAAAGVDGITTNNIAMGLTKQAPLPASLASLATWAAPPVEAIAGAAEFACRAAGPSHDGAAQLEISLSRSGAGTLELFDVGGRRIAARDIGGFSAGRHGVALGEALRSGVYLARLTQGPNHATTRVVVTR